MAINTVEATILGQAQGSGILSSTYDTDEGKRVGNYQAPYFSVVKFKTPTFVGRTTNIEVEIQLGGFQSWGNIFRYAIRSTDQYYSDYGRVYGDITDSYQIVNGIAYIEPDGLKIVFSEDVYTLTSDTVYYLFLWGDNTNSWASLASTIRHTIKLSYKDSGLTYIETKYYKIQEGTLNCAITDSSHPDASVVEILADSDEYYFKFKTPSFDGTTEYATIKLYVDSIMYNGDEICNVNVSLRESKNGSDIGYATSEHRNFYCISALNLKPETEYYVLVTFNSDPSSAAVLTVCVPPEVTITGTYNYGAVTEFIPYECYIDNGSSWDEYAPYIDDGSSWGICT